MPTLEEIERDRPKSVELPRPTAWPMVMAFGITLLFAGLVTNYAVTAVGAVLMLAGAVGWFREVLPHEREETIPVVPLAEVPASVRASVGRIDGWRGPTWARLPLAFHTDSGGAKGSVDSSV